MATPATARAPTRARALTSRASKFAHHAAAFDPFAAKSARSASSSSSSSSSSSRRGRGSLRVRALVNVDLGPAAVLGASVMTSAIALYQVRASRPEVSRLRVTSGLPGAPPTAPMLALPPEPPPPALPPVR